MQGKPTSIDEYIALFPPGVQATLQQVRALIHETAPQASEKISYGMPAFHEKGILVWFGAHSHHLGFYPSGEGIEAFKDELKPYKFSKGAVQFPLDQPMPFDLMRRIVLHRREVVLNRK